MLDFYFKSGNAKQTKYIYKRSEKLSETDICSILSRLQMMEHTLQISQDLDLNKALYYFTVC